MQKHKKFDILAIGKLPSFPNTKTHKVVSGTDNWPSEVYRYLVKNRVLIIMSVIPQTVRPNNLQKWIAVNAAGSLKGTATDSWYAYLKANGGTGQTLHDLEQSFLTAQLVGAGTLVDRWNMYLAAQAGSQPAEKCRSKFR